MDMHISEMTSMRLSEGCPIQWTHPLEYRLLTGEGQSHVYPPHGHPVQVCLPVRPLEPDGGVTDRAHVLEEPDPGQ